MGLPPWRRLAVAACLLSPLTPSPAAAAPPDPPPAAPPPAPAAYAVPDGDIGCSALSEGYCDALWSPRHEGNLRFDGDPDGPPVLLGKTENDLDHALWQFRRAKLDARPRLPPDLARRLTARGYFRDLARLLGAKPLSLMSLADREEHRALAASTSATWEVAITSTVTERVSRRFPGYHRLRAERVPTAAALEAERERDRLNAEVFRVLWEEHPLWRRAAAQFEEVRAEFLRLIAEEAPAELRAPWSERIRTVTLTIPGSDPRRVDAECATSENNASYSPLRNTVTLCAGAFVGGHPRRTLAHELAHALGPHRSALLHRSGSALAPALRGLREATCRREFSGCAAWEGWKRTYPALVGTLGPWSPPPPERAFLSCLQKRSLAPALDPALVRQIARDEVNEAVERGAKVSQFLYLIKDQEILRDGSQHENPGYLNPCGRLAWPPEEDPTNPQQALPFLFVNEYRCQQERSPDRCAAEPERCFRAALDLARDLTLRLMEQSLLVPGSFSSVTKLQRERMAEDVGEDAADALGQRVLARLLSRVPDLRRRRAQYLGTVSSMCDPPSIKKLYPREARAQKDYYYDPHALHVVRRQSLLSAPIREALRCSVDFTAIAKECSLEGASAGAAPAGGRP